MIGCPQPRIGKPVEIQALWYNALCLLEKWCIALGEPVDGLPQWRETIEQSFMNRFWFEEGGYCYDVVDGPDGNDAALRPNQLIALSLVYTLVPTEAAQAILAVVTDNLLTPAGLRSLASGESQYRGLYGGTLWEREGSYHNGTVWGWLIGPYPRRRSALWRRQNCGTSRAKRLCRPSDKRRARYNQ